MQDIRAQKIKNALALIKQAVNEISSIIEENPVASTTKQEPPQFNVSDIKNMGREKAEQFFAQCSHKELGEIFITSGGAKGDKQRSKQWLIGRILFYLFDFESGHNIIQGYKE